MTLRGLSIERSIKNKADDYYVDSDNGRSKRLEYWSARIMIEAETATAEEAIEFANRVEAMINEEFRKKS